jgi:hypothetical protein
VSSYFLSNPHSAKDERIPLGRRGRPVTSRPDFEAAVVMDLLDYKKELS